MHNNLIVKKKIVVTNTQGLHARPAALFVQTANKFNSRIDVKKGKETVNGKSIMGVMMLAAAYGTELTVIAEGEDAEAAISGIKILIDRKFDEE